ncbi:MAG: biotin synthase [Defluviitaleaceae bacterium]|nr:biotin synthase [Defluviitaleaceae bacterium]
MANVIIKPNITALDKIRQMQRDAAFDVADGNGDEDYGPDLLAIRDDVRSKGTLPALPKIMASNDCVFNCAYCGLRISEDNHDRYTHTPKDLADISVKVARESRQGIFISSAVCKNADNTGELILETVKIIRNIHHYTGFIHAKVMPGTDYELIRQTSLYANRMSINIEVAKSEGYSQIARNKSKDKILSPMGHIHSLVKANKERKSAAAKNRYSYGAFGMFNAATSQATQIMAGSTGESDFEILRLSNALYKKYDLKRVYYTPFHYTWSAKGYSELPRTATPVWRMKRLYQADRLMQLYGFTPEEIAPDAEPDLVQDLDPKAAWVLRNIHMFPIEVNTADYEMLLRTPGIGTTYAERIVRARRQCRLTHDALRKLGVSLKRSQHFITCGGVFKGIRGDNVDTYKNLLVSPLS